jgi:outer membrane protein OmpA-like peptidoglycan-associated protein
MSNVKRIFLGIGLLLLSFAMGAHAEEEGTLDVGEGGSVDKSKIIEMFKPQEPITRQFKKKSESPQTAPKLSMHINFASNSSRLDEAGKQALQPLGEALASEDLKASRFVIEGHTDAKGKAAANMRLSARRAESVKRYLTAQFSIGPGRLVAVGKGSSELLNAADPYSGENRRVVIAPIAP